MTHRTRGPSATPGATRRLFVAVPLPPPAIETIATLVGDVRRQVPDGDTIRWVRLEGLHLTLRFLGPTADAMIARLTHLIDEVAATQPAFEVAITAAGAFPSAARPRVLWLGIAAGGDALGELANALEPHLVALGWSADERPFRAHLTLARCDGVRAGPAAARALTSAAERLDIRFRADTIVLFESLTVRGPAHYVAVHESRLGKHGHSALPEASDAGDTIAAAGNPPRAGRKGALGAT